MIILAFLTKRKVLLLYSHTRGINSMSKIDDKDRFYYNTDFLGSPSGRSVRILSEYYGPLQKLQRNKISDTIVFFGSARLMDGNEYYQKARELSFKLTKWNLANFKDENRIETIKM